MADRRHLLGSCVGRPEALLRLVKPSALEQRSSQYELRRTDLVKIVLPTLQERERLPRELVCLVVFAAVQMNAGDSLQRLCGVGGGVGIERPRIGRLEMLDRVLLVSQEEREAAEHEMQAADVPFVVDGLVELLRPLRIAARENVVPFALRDEGRLEVRTRDRGAISEILRELERPLDVVPRGLVVAKTPAAPRAPLEDVGAQQPARMARALRELEGLVEERDCRRDARELVAAHAEPHEDVGAVDIGELRPLDELACALEEVDSLADLPGLLQRPRLAGERASLQRRRA